VSKPEHIGSIAAKIIEKGSFTTVLAQTLLLKAFEGDPAVLAKLPFDVHSLGKTMAGAKLMILILA
jgi:hypothetical protein